MLTKVGHAAEQPPPRKETVRTGQTMDTVTVVLVGRLGPHVYVSKDWSTLRRPLRGNPASHAHLIAYHTAFLTLTQPR